MKLWPADNPTDPRVGGFVAEMPSGVRKAVSWRSEAPIEPLLDAAKEYVSKLVKCLIDGRHMHDVEATNWASAVAGVQKILSDWNEGARQRLRGDEGEAMKAATQRARARYQ